MSSHRSLKTREVAPSTAHANQARASARKRAWRAEREQAEQQEASTRGLSVTQLHAEKQAEVQGIIKEHRDDYGAGIGHQTSYWW